MNVKPATITVAQILAELSNKGRVHMDRAHGSRHICPVCQEDCARCAMVDLIYTFEVCDCGDPDYDHLVEQLYHRSHTAGSDFPTDTWQAWVEAHGGSNYKVRRS